MVSGTSAVNLPCVKQVEGVIGAFMTPIETDAVGAFKGVLRSHSIEDLGLVSTTHLHYTV